MTIDAAAEPDASCVARVRSGMIKVAGARMWYDVIDRAIQVHGALGVTADTPLVAISRAAWCAREP